MSSSECKIKRVCVIGAGTAGLCALRHSIDQGFDVICYEHGKEIGGTWIYNENIDPEDEFQNSMYAGLRTNLPKEIMGYPDFPYPDDTNKSYIGSDKVLGFLQSYAKHFQLNNFIKLQHEVLRVRPKSCKIYSSNLWEVYVNNREKGKISFELFDYVFVCNGHFDKPLYPEIENMGNYKGKQIHSHFYKTPKLFEGETVLVIGGGPSGIDIANQLKSVAEYVLISHHSKNLFDIPGVIQKPDVERFTENGAIFKDGSSETFSTVMYCTGYKYSFPFLSIDCGVHIEENSVQPLFKHIININHPSMALIGLPYKILPTHMFDLQVRFALQYFTGKKELPSREDMLIDLKNELQERMKSGLLLRRFHDLGQLQFQYYDDLASFADIEPLKPVITKIMKICVPRLYNEFQMFRDYTYKIFDDSNFEGFIA